LNPTGSRAEVGTAEFYFLYERRLTGGSPPHYAGFGIHAGAARCAQVKVVFGPVRRVRCGGGRTRPSALSWVACSPAARASRSLGGQPDPPSRQRGGLVRHIDQLRCPGDAGVRAPDSLGQFQSWIPDRPPEVPESEAQVALHLIVVRASTCGAGSARSPAVTSPKPAEGRLITALYPAVLMRHLPPGVGHGLCGLGMLCRAHVLGAQRAHNVAGAAREDARDNAGTGAIARPCACTGTCRARVVHPSEWPLHHAKRHLLRARAYLC
jgi:hypothetical protein